MASCRRPATAPLVDARGCGHVRAAGRRAPAAAAASSSTIVLPAPPGRTRLDGPADPAEPDDGACALPPSRCSGAWSLRRGCSCSPRSTAAECSTTWTTAKASSTSSRTPTTSSRPPSSWRPDWRIAALIVLSIWSLRAARHVKSYGGHGRVARSGLRRLVHPVRQLRRAVRAAAARRRAVDDRRGHWISSWQGLFIARERSPAVASSASATSSRRRRRTTSRTGSAARSACGALAAILLTATAYVAMRATRDVEGS